MVGSMMRDAGIQAGFVPNIDMAAALATTDRMLSRAWSNFAPPPKLSIVEWAERYRRLSPEESAIPGQFRIQVTPVLRAVLDSCSDPAVRKVVVQKSAQVGYTAGVVCNVMGFYVHWRPRVQLAVFPREKSAKDFASEKFDPMVRATGPLRARIQLKSRAAGNSQTRKRYPGGSAKLVGSNSPADVKSTSAGIVIIEEPDDANLNVRGQGNSIKLAEERAKTIPDRIVLIGGTPTAKGASNIEAEMATSDKRVCMITCHDCGEEHTPEWGNVVIPANEDGAVREIYGPHRWEEAFYRCPHCGSVWTEEQRINNIERHHRFVPTASSPVHGYYLNELLSTFEGSRVPVLARKYLEARHALEAGDPADMIAFTNNTLGLPWEYRGELPEEDELRDRAESYAEWSAPAGAFVAVLGVDVQHDRLALTCWVFGRGEEMWLACWTELYGSTMVPGEGAWRELDQVRVRTIRHASGKALRLAAVAIDCGDGQTSDAVYAYVRQHHRHDCPVLPVKGASDAEGRVEIWTPGARRIDRHAANPTKAARFGVNVCIVGSAKAKDLILGYSEAAGRIRLDGNGPGRMHWYRDVRADFYEQILGEIKVPSRTDPRKRVWRARTDRRNEALDCTVYALYAARYLGLHLKQRTWWDVLELRLLQAELFAPEPAPEAPTVHTSAPAPGPSTPPPENTPAPPNAVPPLGQDVGAAQARAQARERLQALQQAAADDDAGDSDLFAPIELWP